MTRVAMASIILALPVPMPPWVWVCVCKRCYWVGKPRKIWRAVPLKLCYLPPTLWIIRSLLCYESHWNKLRPNLSRRFWLDCGKCSILEALSLGKEYFSVFHRSMWYPTRDEFLASTSVWQGTSSHLRSLALICSPLVVKAFWKSWT